MTTFQRKDEDFTTETRRHREEDAQRRKCNVAFISSTGIPFDKLRAGRGQK
jgi:hypothetical protein